MKKKFIIFISSLVLILISAIPAFASESLNQYITGNSFPIYSITSPLNAYDGNLNTYAYYLPGYNGQSFRINYSGSNDVTNIDIKTGNSMYLWLYDKNNNSLFVQLVNGTNSIPVDLHGVSYVVIKSLFDSENYLYEISLTGTHKLEGQLTATAGNSQVGLLWSDVTSATGYNVKRALVAGGPYTTIASNISTTTYTDTSVTNGTKYYYVVTAVNSSSEINNSNEVTATPQASLPSSPTNLLATAGSGQIGLTWTSVTGAASYNVKRATTSGGPYIPISTSLTSTTYTDTSVTNGTTYYYVVTAVDVNGESANSNEASATPQAPVPANTDRALLRINIVNGLELEYDITMSEVDAFVNWYNARANGTGPAAYAINKTGNSGPFKNRKDYIIFDKIQNWEVNEYTP